MTVKYSGLRTWKTPRDVIINATSWDAWVEGETAGFGVASSMIDPLAPTSIMTRYGCRQPLQSDGTVYPDNWYLLKSSLGNDAEQAVFDDQTRILQTMGADRTFLWYPNRADISVGAIPNNCDIYDAGIGRHLVSKERNRIRFSLLLQSYQMAYDGNNPPTWGNYPAFVNNVVTLCQHDRYRRITSQGTPNRPILCLYDNALSTDWNVNLTKLNDLTTAITNAGLGTPVYIQMNGDVNWSNTCGCRYITRYIGLLAGTHNSYANLVSATKKVDVLAANAARCLSVVFDQDNRPRGIAQWTDTPVYTEIEQYWRDRYTVARSATTTGDPEALIGMYDLSSIDEGNVFFPSVHFNLAGVN